MAPNFQPFLDRLSRQGKSKLKIGSPEECVAPVSVGEKV